MHDRDAHDSVLEILAKHSDELPKVVIHCFTGTQEHIKAYLEKGFYIGVTGFVCKGTFVAYYCHLLRLA